MKKGRYLIIFLLTFFVGSFFCIKNVNSIDTETEGYELNYGAIKDVNVQSAGKNLRRSATPNVYLKIFVPTKTLLEWNNFCASKPSDVNCCPVLSTAMTNGGYSDLASCNYSCNTNYFHNSNNCTQCSYSAYANYQCLQASGMWRQVSTRANGNDTECPPLYQDTANTCVYCTVNSSDSCTITNGVGTNPYTCTNNNKVYSGCVVATCNAGYYKANSTTCSICAAGTWTPAGNTLSSCTPCAAGYYQGSQGQSSCTACGAGSTTNTLTGTGATTCTACAAGTYDGDSSSQTACSTCGAGNVTNTLTGTGATTCTACAGGTYDGDSSSQTACSNCGAGYYCAGGTARSACAAGTYTASANASSCNTCGAGYFTDTLANPGATICTLCSPGRYDDDGLSTTACSFCGAGYYCTGGTARIPCEAGTYTGSGITASCAVCAAGNVTDTLTGTGATTCTACAAGTYDGDSNSTTACSNCGAGYYCTGGTARSACDAGRYSASTNATSSSACSACANGTYSASGAASCTACTNMTAGHGTYTGNATSNSCPFTCTVASNSGSTIYTGYFGSTCQTACTYSWGATNADCSATGKWQTIATNTNSGGSQCPTLYNVSGTTCTCASDGNTETNDVFEGYCGTVGAQQCGPLVTPQWNPNYYRDTCNSNHTCCYYECTCSCECSCNTDSCRGD